MEEDFLRRWSRRKHENAAEAPAPAGKPAAERAEAKPPEPLPPVDKITPESDFTPFMQPKVEDALRRVALKKLFSDPHFNVPDPFEPFSGDWTGGDPIPDEMLARLNQARTHVFGDKKDDVKEDAAPAQPESDKVAAAGETAPEAKQGTGDAKQDEPGRQDA